MSNTDTNVVVTMYRAEFRGIAPFADGSAWQIRGGMEYRYTMPRRRRATVVREWQTQASSTELARKRTSDDGRAPMGHVHPSMLIDSDAVIAWVPETPGSRFGTAVLIEQVTR